MNQADLIWMNGELVAWEDAKVHVLTHGLHYGTGVFEGERCYDTELGPAVFRHREQNRAALSHKKTPDSPQTAHRGHLLRRLTPASI